MGFHQYACSTNIMWIPIHENLLDSFGENKSHKSEHPLLLAWDFDILNMTKFVKVVGNFLLSERAISRKCEINLFRVVNDSTEITSIAIDPMYLGRSSARIIECCPVPRISSTNCVSMPTVNLCNSELMA